MLVLFSTSRAAFGRRFERHRGAFAGLIPGILVALAILLDDIA
jgi:hypothetical protein